MQRSTNRLAVLLVLLAACAAGPCRAETSTPDTASLSVATALLAAAATPTPVQDEAAVAHDAVPVAPAKPPSLAARLLERGRASWYAHRFHGRRTASGEPYDRHALTAAHPTLPIASYARVRNPANGREVVVRINDRGPFRSGHIIDVSHAAATVLGILRGARDVEIEPLTDVRRRTGMQERAALLPTSLLLPAAGPAPQP